MKAEIITKPKPPEPFVVQIEFDSKEQYALFRKLFTTSCICQTMRDLGEPALGTLWDGILPDGGFCQHDCAEITEAIKRRFGI